MKRLGIFTGTGAAVGATTFGIIGGIGVAATGTAFGIGLIGLSLVGVVVGAAAKGIVDSINETTLED